MPQLLSFKMFEAPFANFCPIDIGTINSLKKCCESIRQQSYNFIMEFLQSRQSDPEYLKSVIAQKGIIIDEQKRRYEQQSKQFSRLQSQYDDLHRAKQQRQQSLLKDINNLNLAIKDFQSEMEILKHEKSELEFLLNNTKVKLQEFQRQHSNDIERITLDYESQKELLSLKVATLEKNLAELRKYYRVEEQMLDDKKKIIEDSNRDLRGFSNEKQERLLIIQNQQFKNQIEYQSKNLTLQLDRNQKLSEEIKQLKIELNLHKEIEADLVKRSSLAQTLIKKLYREIQQTKKAQLNEPAISPNKPIPSQVPESSRAHVDSAQSEEREKEHEETINKLKFELASVKNYNRYLESLQRNYSRKYETLASLLADYLQNLLLQHSNDPPPETVLNLPELRSRHPREWRFEEMEAVVQLLLVQLKPFISKQSLTAFPEPRNINVSFVQETAKEAVSLPRLAENYEKSYEKESKRGQNRFKDIPIDISTKILRSNLREWGSKIKYGNMPVGILHNYEVRKLKSKSNAEENAKTFL